MSGAREIASLQLGSAGGQPFGIDANMVVTGRTCVLGASGSGKSYAVGVICEELCRNELPFTIVDTEGEYAGIKERYQAIWVGEEERCDLRWSGTDLEDLAVQAPDISPVILDVSDLDSPREMVGRYLAKLYSTLTERRTPYLVVVEEADKFIPQSGARMAVFDEIARRGRKRGLGLMLCSQRPSLIDKNVLSQCGNQLVGKLIIQNDLKSVSQFFPGRGVPKELTAMGPGEFYAMGALSPTPVRMTFRARTTRHGGVTPVLKSRTVRPYMGAIGSATGMAPEGQRGAGQGRGTPAGIPGLRYALKDDDIPALVRRERRFGIFGPQEAVTLLEQRFLTLIQVGVRARKGLLRKRFETVYLMLDGSSGREVVLDGGLKVRKGFEKVLDLTALQVAALAALAPDSERSSIDVASALGESKGAVTRVLNQLEEKRLVRSVEIRRRKLFRRMVDLPPEPTSPLPLEPVPVDVGKARVISPKVTESGIREAVKGLWEGADVASFEPILYPLYRVELTMKRRRRAVWLDGRTGRELDL
jgi:DNA-binding transcriptional ArsR family regulator